MKLHIARYVNASGQAIYILYETGRFDHPIKILTYDQMQEFLDEMLECLDLTLAES